MVVRLSQPARDLRSILTELLGRRPAPLRENFVFEFDGTEVNKVLPAGWEPKAVYLSGARQRVGAGNDVTFSRTLGVWSITWDTAPLVTDWVSIDAEQEQ